MFGGTVPRRTSALVYLMSAVGRSISCPQGLRPTLATEFQRTAARAWPWDASWFKPTTVRRDLEKALALGLAEIERTDHAHQEGN